MKQYHIRIFLNHKKITSCQRIAETWINCEDISRAKLYSMEYMRSQSDLSVHISDGRIISKLSWEEWVLRLCGAMQVESEWFKGGWKNRYDVCFRIWVDEIPEPKPKEVCPHCNRPYDDGDYYE